MSMLQAEVEALLLKFGPRLVVLYFPKLYPSNSARLPSFTSPSFLVRIFPLSPLYFSFSVAFISTGTRGAVTDIF